MTIGQKIAQKRKELGLSQEALGEQLGVSRQAIYKWESDTTLPEIEKLIALSRIFSVSVGWLLGEEESASAESTEPAPRELTEDQLRMVQEIVDRYLAAQPAPAVVKRRRWPFLLASLVVAAGFLFLLGRLDRMNSQYNNLQNSISNVNHTVNSQISSITQQVETILKSQNELTASYDAKLLSVDPARNRATFSVQAVPKRYVDGMTARFLADSGDGPVEVPGVLGEGQTFSAEVTCPLTDLITLSVVFQSGDTRETQVLKDFYSLYSETIPAVTVMGDLWGSVGEDHLLPVRAIFVSLDGQPVQSVIYDDILPSEIARIQVGLFCDQKLVHWYDELDGQPDDYHGDFGDAVFFQRPAPVTMEPGRIYCEAAVVTDEYGRVFVDYDGAVALNEEGDFADFVGTDYSNDPADWEF